MQGRFLNYAVHRYRKNHFNCDFILFWDDDNQLKDITKGEDLKFYSADACPSLGWSPDTELEAPSVLNNVVCCDSSDRCKRYPPCETLSHTEASEYCETIGSQLCSLEQLSNGNCCNKGCLLNAKKVWTRDSHKGRQNKRRGMAS